MKTLRGIFLICAGLCAPLVSHAAIGQVKNLSAAGSSVVCIPGATDQVIVLQNNSATTSMRFSLDGGAGYIDPITGKPGTNPTPTTGYLLLPGQQITISTTPFNNVSQGGLHKPIVAIMVSGTGTLDIITDGTLTQFPTT